MKYLIIGLGNPGEKYENSRHNIGFKVLDRLASLSNISFSADKLADVSLLKHKGRQLVLLKPNTFMNLSGKAVNYWMQKEKVSVDNILVVSDDIALPFSTIRIRAKGSDGGHNGLKDIIEVLQSTSFPRIKFGIGSEFNKGRQSDYVLGNWSDEETNLLEEKMDLAQKITTMVLSLRKKERVRVRQPLQKIMIPITGDKMKSQIISVQNILLSELNVKEIEFISDNSNILTKQIKPNFKTLGPKFGKDIKIIIAKVNQFTSEDIKKIDSEGQFSINQDITIDISDVEISSADIPGWKVMSQDGITVALDVTLSEKLKEEGLARELVNRIQNIRKDYNFEVTDKIEVDVEKNDKIDSSISNNLSYICGETLANSLNIVDVVNNNKISVDLVDGISVNISIKKI